MAMASSASTLRLVDIGCNLTVDQFSGEYHGKTVHSPDLDCILARAALNGVRSFIVTGGTYLTICPAFIDHLSCDTVEAVLY